ncbi:hypothetical protein E0Z10_g1026 [Xylaria hypoxylon]|uniref:SnoaL-like domain-containing protein n=1 Tax=Xylaria hypoxylon TaxID=37992 RepID=A0A4Z0ZFZ9_9PEZI|nr:hypothetical protein E0Z10_g1026 [Xylaria hypoxylon]
MPTLTRNELLAAAKAFCDSFAQKKSLDEVLSHFSSPSPTGGGAEIIVHEHGLPQLAPFLGRDFRGLEGAREYFETVGEYLSYEDMRFVEFIADASLGSEEHWGPSEDGDGGKVVARGKARFTWTRLLRRYEVWADSGAAYLASRGELGSAGDQKG